MAWNVEPIFEREPYVSATQFLPADSASTKKDLIDNTAGGQNIAEGIRVDQISVVSTDSSSRVLNFYHKIGSTSYRLPSVSVAANAGTDGTAAPVDAISTIAPTLAYIVVPFGHVLQVENATTITAAKAIDVVARGGKLQAES